MRPSCKSIVSKTLSSLRWAGALIAFGSCLPFAAAQTDTINSDMSIVLIHPKGSAPSDAIVDSVAKGRNLQAIVSIPEAEGVGARLLDPDSVSVAWNGVALDTYVFYKQPQLAVLFTLLDDPALADAAVGELTMEARFLGESEVAAGWKLSASIPEAAFTSATLVRQSGRSIRLKHPDGTAVVDGRLFGQRRSDLYAAADSDGVVLLDAPTRNTPDHHLAWAPGAWTTAFDPITSPVVTIEPRSQTGEHSVSVRVLSESGEPVPDGLLLVDNGEYIHVVSGEATVTVPANRKAPLVAITAGYPTGRAIVDPDSDEVVIRLKRPYGAARNAVQPDETGSSSAP